LTELFWSKQDDDDFDREFFGDDAIENDAIENNVNEEKDDAIKDDVNEEKDDVIKDDVNEEKEKKEEVNKFVKRSFSINDVVKFLQVRVRRN